METQNWKSPRKVEEEIKQYQRERFEAYMKMADDGVLTQALGITALREELESGVWSPENGAA